MHLGFAKAHHKIPPRRKMGMGLVWGAPQNSGFPYNTYATAEASDLKFGMQLGFAQSHNKIILTDKSGRGHVLGKFPQYFAVHL